MSVKWHQVCDLNDILPGTGVCALVAGEQVALFRPTQAADCYAVSNFDPFGQANVLSRGLIGEQEGRFYVASPLKKQRFWLDDGQCLESSAQAVKAYAVKLEGEQVLVAE